MRGVPFKDNFMLFGFGRLKGFYHNKYMQVVRTGEFPNLQEVGFGSGQIL